MGQGHFSQVKKTGHFHWKHVEDFCKSWHTFHWDSKRLSEKCYIKVLLLHTVVHVILHTVQFVVSNLLPVKCCLLLTVPPFCFFQYTSLRKIGLRPVSKIDWYPWCDQEFQNGLCCMLVGDKTMEGQLSRFARHHNFPSNAQILKINKKYCFKFHS